VSNPILDGMVQAFQMIFSGDPTLYGVLYRSLVFSGIATILALLWATPIAMVVGLKDFRGKSIVKGFFTGLIGLPTVALGLILWLLLSKVGPFGFLGLLYTPGAIILGEAILITPLIVSIGINAIEAVDPEMLNLAKTLGASESQASVTILKEALSGIVFANVAGFNRAIAELGVALMVGGNLAGFTDVLTTDISTLTARAEFATAIALTIILLAIVFGINLIFAIAKNPKVLFTLGRLPQ
jgi:tungstate transport system permease protein